MTGKVPLAVKIIADVTWQILRPTARKRDGFFTADYLAAVSATVASFLCQGVESDYAAEYGFVHFLRRRLLRFRYVVTSAMSIYLLGVAGFAAATDYSYFIMDGFTSRTDNFVFTIVNFVAATDCSPP
jgi:hypothetical protein